MQPIYIILTLLLLILNSRQPTYAQEALELSLSPTRHEIKLLPGKKTYLKGIIQNGSQPIIVTLIPTTFKMQGVDGSIEITNNLLEADPERILDHFKLIYPLMDWGEDLNLDPYQEKEIVLEVSAAPERALSDMLFYCQLITTSTTPNPNGISHHLVGGFPVIVSVANSEGQFNTTTQLSRLNLPTWLRNTASFPLEIEFLNRGSNITTLEGEISLRGLWGDKQTSPLTPTLIPALNQRRVGCENLPSCRLTPPFPVGVYRFELYIGNSGGINQLVERRYILACPWWIVITAPLAWLIRRFASR